MSSDPPTAGIRRHGLRRNLREVQDRREEEEDAMTPDDPRHGTYAGASEHRQLKHPICGPCLRAERNHHALTLVDRMAGRPRTVPALGTVRRIQALQVIGWTIAEISRRSGVAEKTIRNPMYRGVNVYRGTADAIATTYETLCMTLPVGGYHERCRRMAARRGYAPPLAWDDIDCDLEPTGIEPTGRRDADDIDPHIVDRLVLGERLDSTRAEKEEAMRRWLADGGSGAELCRTHGWKQGRYSVKKEAA